MWASIVCMQSDVNKCFFIYIVIFICSLLITLWYVFQTFVRCKIVFHWHENFMVFTRGQFWPSGIVVACVCLTVCPSVRPSICPSVCALSTCLSQGSHGQGKSGNWEITLPALESQGIPHVLFKIREKSVNSVSSRQYQNNICPRPDFRAAHLFPRFNGPFSSFLRAYFARCQFDRSSLRTVFTWHQFSKITMVPV